MEEIIRDTITVHMKENELLSKCQFGFVKGRSTVLQLLKVLDIWTETLDNGGCIDVIYCDFMKAFDKVPHSKLIKKIQSYGIKGNLINWIIDLLSHRKQRIRINNIFSNWQEVISGIPQGSVIGPLLFVIFINDLPDVIKNSHIFLFADDMKLFNPIYNEDNCNILQKDLTSAEKWSETSLLKFHPDKCCNMRIGRSSIRNDGYTMGKDQKTINKAETVKDIGVTFDSSLNFEAHMPEKINKANSMMGIIRRTFEYLDDKCFSTVFKSLVRPHIEYANQVWSPYLMKHITALEKVQRRATKLIPGYKELDYKERLIRLKLPTLSYRRLRGDMIEIYKILTGKYDSTVTSNFVTLRDNDSITRGHNLKIFKERCRLNIRKNSFVYRSTDVWNSLPQSVVDAPSVQSFEGRLDKLWKNHPIKNDFTAPPQLWTVSPLDACAQSQINDQDRAGTRGRNA